MSEVDSSVQIFFIKTNHKLQEMKSLKALKMELLFNYV